MPKSATNRRQHKRLRIDRGVTVPIQVFPVLPFLGEALEAKIINISSGGMAVHLKLSEVKHKMSPGTKIKVHFRLPGQPLCECAGAVTQNVKKENASLLGIRFTKTPRHFSQIIEKMCADNDRCDARLEQNDPLCELSCSFHSLCRKPLRFAAAAPLHGGLEIAFQQID